MSDISKIRVGETVYDIKDQAGRDAFTNSKVNFINDGSDDDHIPTAKTVFDYGQTIKTNILEKKISTIDSSSDDDHFPSAKAVYDYCQTIGGSGGSGGGSSEGGASSAELTALTKRVNERFEFHEQDYYAIQTCHVVPDLTPIIEDESSPVYGMYKLLDFVPKYEAVTGVSWETLEPRPYIFANMGVMVGADMLVGGPGGIDVSAVDGDHPDMIMMLIPQEFVSQEPNGEELVEITYPAGVYLGCSSPTTINFLVKKDKYIHKQRYSMNFAGDSFMNAYFKITDNVDLNSIYSAYGPKARMGIKEDGSTTTIISYAYDCGGRPVPIEEIVPEFSGFPGVYAVPNNPMFAAFMVSEEQGLMPSIVIFTQALDIPEDVLGTAISVTPGVYCFGFDLPILEVVTLQEKEIEIDLDEMINKDVMPNSIIDTLVGGLLTDPTQPFQLDIDETQLKEGAGKEFYNSLKAAFYQKGLVKFKTLSTEIGNNMDFLNMPNIWAVAQGSIMCAGIINTVYLDNMWVEVNLQITSANNHFSMVCQAKVR
jgi:hypothetical protein